MKIMLETVYYAKYDDSCYGKFDVYLNGELVGWMGGNNRLELEDVLEGENTILLSETNKKTQKIIKFWSSQDVKIWIRGTNRFETKCRFETLIKGKDLKVLEEIEEFPKKEQTSALDKFINKYL